MEYVQICSNTAQNLNIFYVNMLENICRVAKIIFVSLSKHIIFCRNYLLYYDLEGHMHYILLTIQQTTSKAPSNNIVGIGGIIVTLLVGIVTCLVTWKLTMKSIKQLKISYNVQIFPILSNSVTKNKDINLADLKIQYKDKELLNPCLLALEIINIGNEAINEPPIKIWTDENIEIIPGYFEDIPAGYEELWSFDKPHSNSCNILLKHINPKQVVKTRFFLDNLPQKKLFLNVLCKMYKYRKSPITKQMPLIK